MADASIRMMMHAVISCLLAACGGPGVPGYPVRTERVDSLRVTVDEGCILAVIYSAGGIGSCTLSFEPHFSADSLKMRLYYREGRPYSLCENLEVQVGEAYTGTVRLLRQGPSELFEGELTVPLGTELETLILTWIDFYRN